MPSASVASPAIPAAAAAAPDPREPQWLSSAIAFLERHWRVALGVAMALDVALLLHMGRGFSFFGDDWDFVQVDYGGGIRAMLLAHVGNISVFPIAIYKVLFHLVGLNHYAVYRLVVIVLHLISASLIFALASRRLPRAPALLATLLILFLDAAWEDLIWAFQMGYLLSVAGGLATWLALERNRRSSDVAALLCLVVSMGSSSLGIAFMAGVFVELAWRRELRRMWIVAVPAALYVLWYLGYGESEVTTANVINSPGYAEDLAAAAFGALAGRGLEWGRPLALLGVAALVLRLARALPISARLAGLLATGLTLWIITALARATVSAPETSRYTYLGAVVIVLVAVELLRGVPIAPRATAVAAVIVAVSIITGLTLIRNAAPARLENGEALTAELGALELAAAYAPPGYAVDLTRAPTLRAGPYLHTVRAMGSSPALSPARLLSAKPVPRAAADTTLLALETPRLTPLASTAPSHSTGAPHVLALASGASRLRGGCIVLTPTAAAGMTAVFALRKASALLEDRGAAPVTLGLRRFGEPFDPLAQPVQPRHALALSIPPDSSPVPWQLQTSSTSSISVCA